MRVWLDDARRHPRHLLLGGLVAGLVIGAAAPGGWPIAAVAGALAVAGASPWLALWVRGGPPTAAVLGAGIVVAIAVGALVAHARMDAIDATTLTPLLGRQVHMTATVLEPPERTAWGTVLAPAELGNGERVVLRLASHGGVRARWPRSPTGAEVSVRGRMLALGPRRRARAASGRPRADLRRPARADRAPARRHHGRAGRGATARGGGAVGRPVAARGGARARDGARAGRRARRGRP